MERKIVIALGSGASVGSGYTLKFFKNKKGFFPTNKDFFEKDKKWNIWNETKDNNDYACILNLKINDYAPDTKSLEDFWNYIDQLRRHIFDSGLISEDKFNIKKKIIAKRQYPKVKDDAEKKKKIFVLSK